MKRNIVAVITLCSTAIGLSAFGAVPTEDVTLVPVVTDNLPVFYSLTGYANTEDRLDPTIHQMPMFKPYDYTQADWWDNVVAEQLQGRMPAIMMATRGVSDPNDPNDLEGDMNPRQLVWLIDAFNRAGINPDMMKVTCFVDSPSFVKHYNDLVYGYQDCGYRINFEDTNNIAFTFFERGIKPWFDTVSREWWMTVDMNGVQRPLIQFFQFHTSLAKNLQENFSKMLTALADRFEDTYGVRPCFNIDERMITADDQLANQPDVYCLNRWFIPSTDQSYTLSTFSGRTSGHLVPGYAHANHFNPGDLEYLDPHHYISRQGTNGTGVNGETLLVGLSAAISAGAKVVSVEGWTDDIESAGIYRSLDVHWTTPNQYINLMRRYTDLRTETLRLEFEGCDNFYDTTSGNSGGEFRRDGDLDIQKLPGTNGGWSVGWIAAGEWMEFKDINLAPGTYIISIRYAADGSKNVSLAVNGVSLGTNDLPTTGGASIYDTHSLGTITVGSGTTNQFRLTSHVSGGLYLDWLFIKRLMLTGSLKSSLNNLQLTAIKGGADQIKADSSTTNNYQTFILCDRNGGKLEHGDQINIQCHNGLYLSAKNGGNDDLEATSLTPESWEHLFVIEKASGSGTITSGTEIILKSYSGHYVRTTTYNLVDVRGTSIDTATKFLWTTNTTLASYKHVNDLVKKKKKWTTNTIRVPYVTESSGTSSVGGAIQATQTDRAALYMVAALFLSYISVF